MNGFLAIFLRELRATFFTSAGWMSLAIGSFLLAIVFMMLCFVPEGPATLQPVLKLATWILMLVAPAFSMRAFSEERRQGTWELLQAAPHGVGVIVLGKFTAMLFQLVLLGVPILVFGGMLEYFGRPDWGEIGCGLLGLFLAGGAWLALGMLASTLTESQLVSYLLALFSSLMVVLCARLLPPLFPAWAPLLFAIDPTRRAEDFAIGLLDTANVVYFISVTVGILLVTRLLGCWQPGVRLRRRSLGNAGIELIGILLFVPAAVACFDLPQLRQTFDLTRTRAYALDPRTEQLLAELPGESEGWSINVLAVSDQNDATVLRQVDEILQRFDDAAPNLVARRIDPLDPRSLVAFEGLLEQLNQAYATELAQYQTGIDQARNAYERLRVFAVEMLAPMRELITRLGPQDPMRNQITELARALTRLSSDGGELESYVQTMLDTDGARPLPDWDGARTALQTTCGFWSEQLAATVNVLQSWSTTTGLDSDLRLFARTERPEFQRMAIELASATDELSQLPPLELSEAARALKAGEAAIILSPNDGAAVIPAWQLFPRTTTQAGDGTVRIDRRFRGEEVLSAAIRSLQMNERPWVVFVHGEDRRMLQASETGSDFFALADALQAARYGVAEWNVATMERPLAPNGTRPVWVVLPPLQRDGVEPTSVERKLLDVTENLLQEGQPVLLSLSRSILPLLGQEDPWAALASALGVTGSTSRLVLERVPLDEDRFETRQWTRLAQPDPETDHPVSRAVGTQALVILQPVGLLPEDRSGIKTLWSIEPSPTRWLESEWKMDRVEQRSEIPAELMLEEPLPVVVAIETDTASRPPQRVVVVGGSGWLLSTVADLSRSLGGERLVLEAPGNRGLILAATAWLAGLDELVPVSTGVSEVSRINGLSAGMRTFIGVLLILVLPVLVLFSGGAIILARGRA